LFFVVLSGIKIGKNKKLSGTKEKNRNIKISDLGDKYEIKTCKNNFGKS